MRNAPAVAVVAAMLMLAVAITIRAPAREDSAAHTPLVAAPAGADPHAATPGTSTVPPTPAPTGTVSASVSSVTIRAAVDRPMLVQGEDVAWMQVEVAGARDAATSRTPVAMAVVVDTSGSMAGDRIENARAAARALIGSLQPGDRVSLVAYSDGAQVLAGDVVITDDRNALYAAVERLRADGSTCMSCGMTEGYAQLRRAPEGHVARVVVLSDGHANRGVSDAAALGMMASRASDARIATTTIGVGDSYNEQLMATVATSGTGAYYFLPEPSAMMAVLERERASMARTVARDVVLTLHAGEGVIVQPGDVSGAMAIGDDVVVRIGQLGAGERRVLLFPLRVFGTDLSDAVQVTSTFIDGSGDEQGVSATLAMARTEDAAAAASAQNREVVAHRERIASANVLEDAMSALTEGDTTQATTALDGLAAALAVAAEETSDEAIVLELDRVRNLRDGIATGRIAGGSAARGLYLQNQARAQEANVGIPAADAMYGEVELAPR